MSWCLCIMSCPLIILYPGNGHYLLRLSQCDKQHTKAPLHQHPQEMKIQCLSVYVCVCVWMCVNWANFPFRWALICVQRLAQESQRTLFYECSFRRKEEEGREERRGGWFTSGTIYGSAGISSTTTTTTLRDRATHLYSPHVRLLPQESRHGGVRGEKEVEGGMMEGDRGVSTACLGVTYSILTIKPGLPFNVCSHKTHILTWSQPK